MVTVAEAVPTVIFNFPLSSAEVVAANPSDIILVSVAKLLTVREYVPEEAELVVVISATLLLSEALLFEKTLLLMINRLSVLSVLTTLLNVCSLFFSSWKLDSFCSSICFFASTRSIGRASSETILLMISWVSRLEFIPYTAFCAIR